MSLLFRSWSGIHITLLVAFLTGRFPVSCFKPLFWLYGQCNRFFCLFLFWSILLFLIVNLFYFALLLGIHPYCVVSLDVLLFVSRIVFEVQSNSSSDHVWCFSWLLPVSTVQLYHPKTYWFCQLLTLCISLCWLFSLIISDRRETVNR